MVASVLRSALRAPGVVVGITVLWAAVLAAGTVVFPQWSAPDEVAHIDKVLMLRDQPGWPDPSDRSLAEGTLAARDRTFDPDDRGRLLERGAAPARRDRPSFESLGSATPSTEVNWMTQHPPGGYVYLWAATTPLRNVVAALGPGDGLAYDRDVGLMRLANALLMLPLPALAYATARRLRAPASVAVSAALVVVAVPQVAFIGAAVNNDNLLILALGVLTLMLARVATGDRSWATAAGVAAAGGLALLTKGFALFVPAWVAVAYATGWWVHTRATRRSREGPAHGAPDGAAPGDTPDRERPGEPASGDAPGWAVVGVAATLGTMVIGGWWWIRNVVVFNRVQPRVGEPLLDPAPAGFSPDWGFWITRFTSDVADRFWGDYAYQWLRHPLSVVLVVLVVAGVVGAGRQRAALAVTLFPVVALFVLAAGAGRGGYLFSGTVVGAQGRYLFGGLVGLVVAVAWGIHALAGVAALRRWQPLATAVAALVSLWAAVVLVLMLHWGPRGSSVATRLAAVVEWSPWPPAVAVGVGVVGAIGVVWVLLGTVALGASRDVPVVSGGPGGERVGAGVSPLPG